MSGGPFGDSDLVTGEAVVLDLRLAKLASRSLALAVDLAVQVALFVVGALLVSGPVELADDALAAALVLVYTVAVLVGYPVALETATRGRTLGKLALGLRVVREDGGPIGFRHALVRGLLAVVEVWASFGSVALVTSLVSAKGRRLGDFLAGTVVVRERLPARAAPAAVMPPPLAPWAAALDLSRVPDDLALAARQFLSRQHQLAPEVRNAMGAQLATALTGLIAPPPPPGTPAWAVLAAVLAERRERDLRHVRPATPAGSPDAPARGAALPGRDRPDPAVQRPGGPFAPPG